jgi:proline dehydrogenase
VALQASLYRTQEDLETLIQRGSSVRLVKGAYNEPIEKAWRNKKDVDASYSRLIEDSMGHEARTSGFYPAFATHDHILIHKAIEEGSKQGISRDRFEFQMLLGVRRDWQQRLVHDGFRVRIYVPFGTQWYPYFMRRLAERPANVLFMARAMLGR